jgi:hypothetical protein
MPRINHSTGVAGARALSQVRFELEQRFSAPVAAVAAVYADPRLLELLNRVQTLCQTELLERVEDESSIRQRVRFSFRGAISPAVTAVVDPNRLTWVEESTLDRRTHHRRFRIIPDHYPDRLRSSGTVDLEDLGSATRRVTRGDLEVHVPFFGGKVAEAIVSELCEFSAAEAAAVQQWLDEDTGRNDGDDSRADELPDVPALRTLQPDSRPSSDFGGTSPAQQVVREYGEQWRASVQGLQQRIDAFRHTLATDGEARPFWPVTLLAKSISQLRRKPDAPGE